MNDKAAIWRIFNGRKWILTTFLLIILYIPLSFFLVSRGYDFIWLIAPAMIGALVAFISIDKFLILTVFLVPLSIQLRFIFPDVPADLFLPTEPMLALIMILMIFRTISRDEVDVAIMRHPVTRIIGIFLVWIFFTSLTGTMPVVSLKYLVTKIWFIAGFFLLASHIFRNEEKISWYFSAYLAGMTPVAIYYLYRLSQFGVLNQITAHSAIRPFFNDHTALGASLAFCIPAGIYLLGKKRSSPVQRAFTLLQLALFSATFVYSYSRAAWISLAVATIFAFVVWIKISWKIILTALVLFTGVVILTWSAVMVRLNENRQPSSLDITKQIQSISNIRNDDSNLERINRWNCAIRMFEERPVLGWGPGTYQFNYAPFQVASEKTKISTNWGERGNAHSEYLGLLAETGVPGISLYLLLVFLIVRRGIHLYRRSKGWDSKLLLLCVTSGIVTYIVHGTLNNFLDTDKISAWFWGTAGVIVALDSVGDPGMVSSDQ